MCEFVFMFSFMTPNINVRHAIIAITFTRYACSNI